MMGPELPEVSFGKVGESAEPDDDDIDEEALEDEPTPEDVKDILGFDPDDVTDE